jgi:hypothetical protein
MFAYSILKGQNADIPVTERCPLRLYPHGHNFSKTPADFRTRVLFDAASTHSLDDFAKALDGSTDLEHLYMRIAPYSWRSKCTEHRVGVDLQVLKELELPNLRTRELAVRSNRDFWSDESVMQEFRKEIESVGRVLMGEDVVITTGIDTFDTFDTGQHRHSQWTFTKKEG